MAPLSDVAHPIPSCLLPPASCPLPPPPPFLQVGVIYGSPEVTSGGQAVFAVVAKDSASKTLKGVGKSFGTLRRTGVTAFKAIAGASVAAAGAIAAFTGSAIKGAIEDERSNILLASALKARGFELDKILPKIEEQIDAARRLGQSDDEVRAGLEVGSRYFKNQEKLLKANAEVCCSC